MRFKPLGEALSITDGAFLYLRSQSDAVYLAAWTALKECFSNLYVFFLMIGNPLFLASIYQKARA